MSLCRSCRDQQARLEVARFAGRDPAVSRSSPIALMPVAPRQILVDLYDALFVLPGACAFARELPGRTKVTRAPTLRAAWANRTTIADSDDASVIVHSRSRGGTWRQSAPSGSPPTRTCRRSAAACARPESHTPLRACTSGSPVDDEEIVTLIRIMPQNRRSRGSDSSTKAPPAPGGIDEG